MLIRRVRKFVFQASLGLSLSALWFRAAAAQEDPFGAAPKPRADAASAKPEALPAQQKREPLAIEMLRSSAPSTPKELLRAAQVALQYGRADEAKPYLAKLLAAKPADDALAPLAALYAPFLLEASRTSDLAPEGKLTAELVLGAKQRIASRDEQIRAAVAQLSDPSATVREAALERLFDVGTLAVNPMLHVLADRDRETQHAAVRAALVQLAGSTELPLIGALDTTNQQLKSQVVAVLGRMRSHHAAIRFVRLALDPAAPTEQRQLAAASLQQITGTVPDLYEAEKYLRREIDRLLGGDVPYDKDALDRVQLWSWDAAKQEVTGARVPRRDAGTLLAARAAVDLAALKPADPAVVRLMLLTNLEWEKVVRGLDQPLPLAEGTIGGIALSAGARAVNQVLADALARERVPAAIAAAEVLAACGDPSVLRSPGSGASPLADAAMFADRRVRLAAALAAVKLSPSEPYPGAGRVAQSLAWFVTGGQANAMLIGHPRGEDAQNLVGLINTLGYDGEAAYSGRAFAERAFANPDFQFLLVTDAIDSPPVEELVQWLRRDYRTAHRAIGVLARGERLDALRDCLAADRYTVVLPRIHSPEVAATTVEALQRVAGRNLLDRDLHVQQAQAALAALIELARFPGNFAGLELLRHEGRIVQALNQPELAGQAATLLGMFGTPLAQSKLVDFASQNSRPLADRQAAAEGFAAAVKSRGLRLTQQQILQQFSRTNQGGQLDAASQEILASLIKTIESPAVSRGDVSQRE